MYGIDKISEKICMDSIIYTFDMFDMDHIIGGSVPLVTKCRKNTIH
ncbi:MAG: hypothetical protein ACFFCV_01875 [Promethearchaeota archaeon]